MNNYTKAQTKSHTTDTELCGFCLLIRHPSPKKEGLHRVVWKYHVHAILSAEHSDLMDIIRDFKRHTATEILKEIKESSENPMTAPQDTKEND